MAAPISRQSEREPVMDSSYPYFYAYTTVLVKKPDVNASKWKTLINPFKWEVLVTIGLQLNFNRHLHCLIIIELKKISKFNLKSAI